MMTPTEDLSGLAITLFCFTVREPGSASGHAYYTKDEAERKRQELIAAGKDVSEIRVQSLLQ